MLVDINKIINDIFIYLSARQKKVIFGRFGLNGRKKTLQEIGDELRVTRERVRQIEKQSIKKLRTAVHKTGDEIANFAERHILACGGVRRDDYFISDIIHHFKFDSKIPYLENKIRFIIFIKNKPYYSEEDEEMNAYWYYSSKHQEDFLNFVKKIEKLLKSKDKKEILEDKLYLNHCKNIIDCHLLSIPKKFAVNSFGDFGFADWAEINPKNIRDKIYLLLKKTEKPLHFKKIASEIYKHQISKKIPHVQTVHNELIRDKRFVLVGRGIYALKEKGFYPGTVKEIIARIIKENGPLEKKKIVELVKSQRIVKDTTIALNLHNRKNFIRLEDGKFDIREI
jgi:hypothetical protein